MEDIAVKHYRHVIEDAQRLMQSFSVKRQMPVLSSNERYQALVERCGFHYKFRLPPEMQALLLEKEEVLSVIQSLKEQRHKERVRQRLVSLEAQAKVITRFFNNWLRTRLRTDPDAVRCLAGINFQWILAGSWTVYCFQPPLLPRK